MNTSNRLSIIFALLLSVHFRSALAEPPTKKVALVNYQIALDAMTRRTDFTKKDVAKNVFVSSIGSHFPAVGWAYMAYENRDLIRKTTSCVYKYLYDQGKISKEDTANVIRIIEAGRTNSVEEMDVSLNREQFLGLKGALKAPDKTDISFEAGAHGASAYVIKVKYKDTDAKKQ